MNVEQEVIVHNEVLALIRKTSEPDELIVMWNGMFDDTLFLHGDLLMNLAGHIVDRVNKLYEQTKPAITEVSCHIEYLQTFDDNKVNKLITQLEQQGKLLIYQQCVYNRLSDKMLDRQPLTPEEIEAIKRDEPCQQNKLLRSISKQKLWITWKKHIMKYGNLRVRR